MRAIVLHGSFESPGGAEAYCLRVAETLQGRFDDVLVLHYGAAVDVALLERRFNVSLGRTQFQSVDLGWMGRQIARTRAFSLSHLKTALFYRRLRGQVEDADLLVSTWIECPFRAPRVIQAIHVPQLICDRESLQYLGWTSTSRLRHALQVAYIWSVRAVMGWSRRVIGGHLTIINSIWTANLFRRHYHARDVRVLYPGVDLQVTPQSSGWARFDQRDENFVVLGRVTPAKEVEKAVEIVSRLRAEGHHVGLHIIGAGNGAYAEQLAALIADQTWVHWHRALDFDALQKLVVRQKWGLHCCQFEHYGIAPAELQALGCITFVHDSGGQREIITNPNQRYTDVDDAVRKVSAVLRTPEIHAQLVAEGLANAKFHTVQKFREQLLQLVDQVVKASGSMSVPEAAKLECPSETR